MNSITPFLKGVPLACLAVMPSLLGQLPVYDFEGLTVNQNLAPQDSWYHLPFWSGTVGVRSGEGINGSKTATIVSSSVSGASRVNDGAFSFLTFSGHELEARIQFDVLAKYGGYYGGGVDFGLGHDSSQDTDPYLDEAKEMGPHFGVQDANGVMRFSIREAAMGNGHQSLGTLIENHWYQVQLVMDFTANGGDGAGSLFYRDLTTGGGEWLAAEGLQNINLKITSNMHSDSLPATWDAMFLRIDAADGTGCYVDNLVSYGVPEPTAGAVWMGVCLLGWVLVRRPSPDR